LAPGNEADIWSLDPETGQFTVVGTGRVSADGSVIETIDGGVRRADWHGTSQGLMAMAPVLSGDNEPTPENGNLTTTRSLCKDIPITAESRFSDFSLRSSDAAQTQNDFDNNGSLDIAAANFPNSDVFILRGNGDGTFSEPAVFPAGTGIVALEAADFNGDGWQDLASANFNGDDITILLNDTSGGLGQGVNYPTGRDARDIIAGDFDVNGIPDLAVANQSDRNVSVLLGDGSGCFFAATNYSVGTTPRSLQQADFNGDEVPDLAVGNSSARDVSILLGEPSNQEGLVAPEGDPSTLVLLEDGTYKLTTPANVDGTALTDFSQESTGEELAHFFFETGLLDAEFVGDTLNLRHNYDNMGRLDPLAGRRRRQHRVPIRIRRPVPSHLANLRRRHHDLHLRRQRLEHLHRSRQRR